MMIVRPWMIAIVGILIALQSAVVGWSAAPLPPDTLTLHCQAFQRNRDLCTGLQSVLRARRPAETRDARLQRARQWLHRPEIQHRARAGIRPQPHARSTPARLLDVGLAELVTGQFGEGMQHLLGAYQHATHRIAAGDAVYLGLLLVMEDLNPDQRADWAADIASRLTAQWRLPTSPADHGTPTLRRIEIARALHLAEIADDAGAIAQFIRFGQAYYPRDPYWAATATR